MNKEKLDQMWESIDYAAIDFLDTEFINVAPKLLAMLVMSIDEYGEVDVGTFDKGSIITYDSYDNDKSLELKFYGKKTFELHLSIFDSEGSLKEFMCQLDENEVGGIPKGLRDIMSHVYRNREPKVFRKNELE